MKKALILTFAIIGLAATAFAQQAKKADLLKETDLFTPDAKVMVTEEDPMFVRLRKQAPQVRLPTFTPEKFIAGTKNGVRYKYWLSDGSAEFESSDHKFTAPFSNWRVGCKNDPIDDTTFCWMSFKDLMIFKRAFHEGIGIGHDHYPGSGVAIRVDGEKPFRGGATIPDRQASLIILRLLTGKTVATRYTKWPENVYVDSTFDLYGFNEAHDYMGWLFGKVYKKTNR